jgi:hypothetical protein
MGRATRRAHRSGPAHREGLGKDFAAEKDEQHEPNQRGEKRPITGEGGPYAKGNDSAVGDRVTEHDGGEQLRRARKQAVDDNSVWLVRELAGAPFAEGKYRADSLTAKRKLAAAKKQNPRDDQVSRRSHADEL